MSMRLVASKGTKAERPPLQGLFASFLETGPKVATLVLLGWLVLLPVLFIALAGTGALDGRFGQPIAKLLRDARLLAVLGNTLLLATVVSVSATAIGVVLAFALEKTRLSFVGAIDKLILVPIMVSPLTGAVAWVTLGRPKTGFINLAWQKLTGADDPLFSIYSFGGIAFVIVLHVAPYVYVNVRNALRNLDGSLEEAAFILGSGTFTTWRTVTLPLIRPAVLSAALLVFVLTLETFSIVGLLGGPARFITLPFNVYLAVNLPPGDWDYAALQGVILIAITGALMVIYWRLVGATGKYSSLGARGFRAGNKVAGSVRLWLALAMTLYLLIGVIVPMAALALQSLLAFTTTRIEDMVVTTQNWQQVFADQAFRRAILNTLFVGACAATLATALSLIVAHLTVFEKLRSFDFLSSLPLAFPGIVLGLALIFLYSGTPIYGSLWLLVVGYTTQFLPFATRSLSTPMMQVDKGLDEAGKVIGAYLPRRIATLTAPLLRGALFASWIVSFTRGIRELNLPIFLTTSSTIVTPVLIWNYMEQGRFGLAATVSVAQVALLVAVVSIANAFERRLALKAGRS
jgi:iron(III) transport system permease protein